MLILLDKVPVFAGLSESARQMLVDSAQERNVATSEIIVSEGESSNRMFVLHSGLVRVCKFYGTPDEIELARLGHGEFFGEMCILETLPRAASVQAIEPSLLYSWSSLAFLKLYNTQPKDYAILVLNMARDLSRRLRKLDNIFAARH